jgi:hypothetical protein
MMFRVGQKMVCVEIDHYGYLNKGQVYIISARCPACPPEDLPAFPFLSIDLLGNPHPCGWRCNAWPARLFRPVVERKTDISVFTNMLTNTKVRA